MSYKPLTESFAWTAGTGAQRRIMEWLAREQPWDILCIRPWGRLGLIVTDCYCFNHWLQCREDGTVAVILEEDEICSA